MVLFISLVLLSLTATGSADDTKVLLEDFNIEINFPQPPTQKGPFTYQVIMTHSGGVVMYFLNFIPVPSVEGDDPVQGLREVVSRQAKDDGETAVEDGVSDYDGTRYFFVNSTMPDGLKRMRRGFWLEGRGYLLISVTSENDPKPLSKDFFGSLKL